MRCPGLHCDGCGSGGGLLAVLAAGGAAAAAVAAFAEELLVAAGAMAVTVLAVLTFRGVRAWRRGWRPSLNPLVAYTPLPAPEPARALPVPQEFHLHLHAAPPAVADVAPAETAELAAIRAAAWRAFSAHNSEGM